MNHSRLCLFFCCLIGSAVPAWGIQEHGTTGGATIAPKKQESSDSVQPTSPPLPSQKVATVRFATFNVAMNRKSAGALQKELLSGKSKSADKIAEIIQTVRPDVLLLNEFDYDAQGVGIQAFQKNFLARPHHNQTPIQYPYVYFAEVNTGLDSGLDLNHDGKKGTANDAFGFGQFPGQYGMVVLSRYPIDVEHVRTFQKFLWKDMPGCAWPIVPKTGKPYYSDSIKNIFRLSSKSHWDLPIQIGDQTIHFLVAHPTPPVFDEEEDRNGCRNHDEIRFWADYIRGTETYHYDDQGKKGGLAKDALFVIAGDMNADPSDGDSHQASARQLTQHPLINHQKTPASDGGVYYSKEQGRANLNQHGNPAFDTGDFNDFKVGNMRIDYCLPSQMLEVVDQGVFWPRPGQPGAELVDASDHRMVWIDVRLKDK